MYSALSRPDSDSGFIIHATDVRLLVDPLELCIHVGGVRKEHRYVLCLFSRWRIIYTDISNRLGNNPGFIRYVRMNIIMGFAGLQA